MNRSRRYDAFRNGPGQFTTLAEILTRTGQDDGAETALREALRIDPYDAAPWDLSGRVLAKRGEFPETLYDFERAIRYRPDFAPHLYDYAFALAGRRPLRSSPGTR